MEWLNDVAAWAWARHHNLLSWYIRPLLLLPFCYFAYRRNRVGIGLVVLGWATSWFWFPAPAEPDPRAIELLAAERAYLTTNWTVWKVAIALLVPVGLGTLALAFWKRSVGYGLVVINAMVLFKVAWTFVFAEADGALLHLVPAMLGLAICNLVLLVALRWVRRRGTAVVASSRQ